MKTRWEIELEYNRATGQAKELENIASEMRGLASNSLGAMTADLVSGWKGENASLYIQKVDDRQEQMKLTATGIGKIAEVHQGRGRKNQEPGTKQTDGTRRQQPEFLNRRRKKDVRI